MSTRVIGVDLGKQNDFTAISVLDLVRPDIGPPETHVVYLERFRYVSYPGVVQRVAALASSPALAGCPLVVDATGVGRAVVDMLREYVPLVEALVITGGRDAVTLGPREHHVPKADLVATLQVLVASRRLKVSSADPLATEFHSEMQDFGYEISEVGHKAFGAAGAHDDLVLSVAMAAWKLTKPSDADAWIEAMRRRAETYATAR